MVTTVLRIAERDTPFPALAGNHSPSSPLFRFLGPVALALLLDERVEDPTGNGSLEGTGNNGGIMK